MAIGLAACGGGGGTGGGSTVDPPAPPPTNQPPVIGGTPTTTVEAGQTYAFQPSASDPEGKALTFSISEKPSWSTFDAATGKLSGAPTAANAGTYSNIVIAVSDGALSASLPAFSITVTSPAASAADLQWVAPTQNEDGSPLTNLAGFKVRYGQNQGFLEQVLIIANPGTTSARIESLTKGTWYFTLAAFTTLGMESEQTEPVSKTIP
jgi:hypothetical protein